MTVPAPSGPLHEQNETRAISPKRRPRLLGVGDDRSNHDIEPDDLPCDLTNPRRFYAFDALCIAHMLIIPDPISFVERHRAASRRCALKADLVRADEVPL